MGKLTKQQINTIIEMTPKELKGQQTPFIKDLGYFTKYGANWAYRAGYVKHNGVCVPVVTVFGEIQ